ncbi:protein-export chaperone SecB [Saccharibacter floricola]|nr:protein-export chaperone SecB [Saccharibacter floricola]
MTKNPQSSDSKAATALKLDLGSQYLCHATIDVPNTPEVLRTLKAPPHLHLVVDKSMREASDVEGAYELRLVVRAFGYPHAPKEGEKLQPLYQAAVVYAGLFGVVGKASSEAREKFIAQEAAGYLFPTARNILLDLVRESGFSVNNPQPIDFRTFWEKNEEAGKAEKK